MTSAPTGYLLPTGLLIDGDWVRDTSAGSMDHVNPATGAVQRSFPVAGPREVESAVAAAQAAAPAWAAMPIGQRHRILASIATSLRVRADEFGLITTMETGMLNRAGRLLAPIAADWFAYYAGWLDKVTGSVYPVDGTFDYTIAEPFGVVAVILTWNGPTASIGMKVAPALAAGCTVVLKPPELAPFSSNLFGRICLDAGLPPGVLNIVPGGPEAGECLVRHPRVDKISFTGGPATAARIQAACAQSLTPLVLELGGKSANIVFADADLDSAVAAAARGVSSMSGQVCVAPTRLLVERSVYAQVVERVAGTLTQVKIGDPFDPGSEMGPVISAAAADRILSMVASARESAAGHVVLQGERQGAELARGFYVSPTVVADVDSASEIAQEEVFGPVLSVMPFDGDDEAVKLANDTRYGLAAYLHTTNLARVHTLARRLKVGNVSVNGGLAVAGPVAPFGGMKDSGYGKEGGLPGLQEFLRTKNVNINLSVGLT